MKLWPFKRTTTAQPAEAPTPTQPAPPQTAAEEAPPAAATGLAALLAAAAALEVHARPSGNWAALPGGRLELGCTGFEIHYRTDPRYTPFAGYDPEGRQLVHGYHLDEMKRVLEQHAAWREQFNPHSNRSNP